MMGRNIVNKKLYLYPKVIVSMTDRDIIDRVAALLKTSTYVGLKNYDIRGKKPWFRAQVNGSRAAEWMVLLLPYMGERRSAKIREILEQYGEIEPTAVRRQRSCKEAYKRRMDAIRAAKEEKQ